MSKREYKHQEAQRPGDCENIALHYSDKCDSLEKAIQDAIELMDEEPAKKILEKALKGPAASEQHPNKKGREDCEDCPYPERHCSECINGDNRAKVSQAFESDEQRQKLKNHGIEYLD